MKEACRAPLGNESVTEEDSNLQGCLEEKTERHALCGKGRGSGLLTSSKAAKNQNRDLKGEPQGEKKETTRLKKRFYVKPTKETGQFWAGHAQALAAEDSAPHRSSHGGKISRKEGGSIKEC